MDLNNIAKYISAKIRKFRQREIVFILYMRNQFLDEFSINVFERNPHALDSYPPEFNRNELHRYIMNEAEQKNIFIDALEMERIFLVESEINPENFTFRCC